MSPLEAAIIARARDCVGARFRLHGRSPETGLDCVGLAAVAYGAERVPSGYALRGGRAEQVIALIDAAGLPRHAGLDPASRAARDPLSGSGCRIKSGMTVEGKERPILLRSEGEPGPAALMLLLAGPYQFHLAIRTERGFVHADAGLRRVTEVPGTPRWPLIAHWLPHN